MMAGGRSSLGCLGVLIGGHRDELRVSNILPCRGIEWTSLLLLRCWGLGIRNELPIVVIGAIP